MLNRPVFYLQNWVDADNEHLLSIASLGLPVILLATDLQKSENPDEILSLFTSGQVHILSAEVEEEKSDLTKVIEVCRDKEWTHLIFLQDYSVNLNNEWQDVSRRISVEPSKSLRWVPLIRAKNKNSEFTQRLLDLDETDYRGLISSNGIYPISQVGDYQFKKNSPFEHNKILVSLLWRDHRVDAVAVDYSESEKLPGGWKKLYYDTVLLALTSLHNTQRPLHSAISMFMGAFWACSPFYGLQTLLIISSAFLFRLSFPVAFLGSQISWPPTYSLIVPLQLYVGFLFTGRGLDFNGSWYDLAKDNFDAWLIGYLFVGTALASLMAGVWYWFLLRAGKRREQTLL